MHRALVLLAVLALPASGQPPPRSVVDVLEGRPPSGAAPEPVDPTAAREGWIHVGRAVAGRYHTQSFVEVEAVRALEHVPGRRLRVALVLRCTRGTFRGVASRDPRLRLAVGAGLGTPRLEAQATLEAAGATDDVRARLTVRADVRWAGVTFRDRLTWVTLGLVVGHDPVDVARDIVRRGTWRWMIAGDRVTDWERWDAGALRADAIRSANCYQFVKFVLHGAGVPERERPQPRMLVNGNLQPVIEEGPVLRAGHRRGSPEVDAASAERGLRDYLRQFAGHYRRAPEGHRPRRGDVVLFYVRDGSGFLQASHIGMHTGQGDAMVHNAGRGPSYATARSLINRLRYDAIVTFQYVGRPTLETR